MLEIRRGAGFCVHPHCDLVHQLVLLDPFDTGYRCARCGGLGRTEPEYGAALGSHELFGEVRVYYRFDPERRSYSLVASACDRSALRANTFALFSPVIRSEERADRVARDLLRQFDTRARRASAPAGYRSRAELLTQGWHCAS